MWRFVRRFIVVLFLFAFVPAYAAPVDINTADAVTLAQSIKGVGAKKAAAIVAYRTEHGPFKTVDALVNVPGIGQATVDKNRSELAVESQ